MNDWRNFRKHRRRALWLLYLAGILSHEAIANSVYLNDMLLINYRRPTGTISYGFNFSESRLNSQAVSREASTTQQSVGLRIGTSGFVYHPALLSFGISFSPTYRESERQNDSMNGAKSQSEVVGYSFTADILNRKPYGIDFHANKRQFEQTSFLRDTAQMEQTTRIATIRLDNLFLPVKLSTSENTIESWGGSYQEFSADRLLHLRGQKTTDRLRLSYDLRNRETERKLQNFGLQTVLYDNAYVTGGYTISENIELMSTLETSRAERNIGETNKSSRARSDIRLKHPMNFQSSWSANKAVSSYGPVESRATSYSGSISHKLYENLASNIDFSTSSTANSQYDAQRASFNYNRRIPWGGLSLSHHWHSGSRQLSGQQDLIRISDETYVFFGAATSLVLNQSNVDVDSVLITSADGSIIYQEGFDYSISGDPETTLITRNLLGSINNDETVLISYTYTDYSASLTDSESRSTSIGLRLGNHLSLTASRRIESIEALGDNNHSLLRNKAQNAYGAQFFWKGTETRVELQKERNLEFSMNILTLSEHFKFSLGNNLEIDTQLSHSRTEIPDRGYESRTTTAQMSSYRLLSRSRRIGISASAFLAKQKTIGQSTENGGLILGLNYSWRLGAWKPILALNLSTSGSGVLDDQRQTYNVSLNLTREIR